MMGGKDLSALFCPACRGHLRTLKAGQAASCLHRGVTLAMGPDGGRTVRYAPGRGPLAHYTTATDLVRPKKAEVVS